MNVKNTSLLMRVIHRYLGFFLTGIMAVYALSGVTMIFRDTDFLQRERETRKVVAPGLQGEDLGQSLRIRGLRVDRQQGDLLLFKEGSYNQETGEAVYMVKSLPFILDKMTHMHKATHKHPLYWLNIFFGVSLLFFVVSSFWMFRPKTTIFKNGLYWTLGGIVLTLVILFV